MNDPDVETKLLEKGILPPLPPFNYETQRLENGFIISDF